MEYWFCSLAICIRFEYFCCCSNVSVSAPICHMNNVVQVSYASILIQPFGQSTNRFALWNACILLAAVAAASTFTHTRTHTHLNALEIRETKKQWWYMCVRCSCLCLCRMFVAYASARLDSVPHIEATTNVKLNGEMTFGNGVRMLRIRMLFMRAPNKHF